MTPFTKNTFFTSIMALAIASVSTFTLAKNEPVDTYIIKFNTEFKGKTHIPKALLESEFSVKFKKTFNSAFSGVVVELTEKQAKKLSKKPFIEMVEKDTVNDLNISWGQDRIDQRNLPLNGSFNVSDGGNGVNIYIIDTGINRNHIEFSGRIGTVTSTISGGASNDCHGHGTHVASTAAGQNYGVAPDATVNSIRIAYNCQGRATTSDMIEAFEWIINNGQPNSIINLSYTVNSHLAMYAMNNAIIDGHVVVSSAGNNNLDACIDATSKYKVATSIVVGASTLADKQYSLSNYGSCVDIYAPGSGILAANHSSNTSLKFRSGTSMASPFVAGLAAVYRSTYPNATPNEVVQALVNSASSGKLSGLGAGSPNKLAYNNLTRPSVYWKNTGRQGVSLEPNALMPFGPCTAGQSTIQTVDEIPGWGIYVGPIWECK